VPAGRGDVERPKWWPVKAPVSSELPVPETPRYSEKKLDNGLRVIVVPNKEVPFVSVMLGNGFGAWSEYKPGSASMAMKMLTRGTKTHNEEQLADELETYAISLCGSGGMDGASVGGNCVTDQLDRMMKLMAEVVLEPNFPQSEFNKLKQQVLTSLTIRSAEPEYIAQKNWQKIFYGEHPYSRNETGEVEDVNRLNVKDANQWYGIEARLRNMTLIYAGDIDEERAYELAQKYFKPVTTRTPIEIERLALPKIPDVNSTKIYLVDNPGMQSRIIVGQKGILRTDPRYYTTRVINDYFGLGFTSRLNESVRVQKGLTYGIYGGYFGKRFAGEFDVITFTKTSATAKTLEAIMEEIRKLKQVPPDENDVAKSRSYIVGSFLERRETPQQIADDLWTIISNGLPMDYFERMLDSVRKTVPADCMRVVNETVDPNKMVIVVVGKSGEIKNELAKIAPVIDVNSN
jgi:zinc protease